MMDDDKDDDFIDKYFQKAAEFMEQHADQQDLLKKTLITPEEDEERITLSQKFEKESNDARQLEIRKVEALEKIADILSKLI